MCSFFCAIISIKVLKIILNYIKLNEIKLYYLKKIIIRLYYSHKILLILNIFWHHTALFDALHGTGCLSCNCFKLLRWLVETPSRNCEHYRMTDDSRQSIIWHFHVKWKCRMIGFARWRFNLFECRRRMLQRHLPNGVERTQLRSPDCW